ncbi:MAG: hypothetical protein WDM77_03540 [Steroidobacteraceae bacterium]
MTRVRAVAAVVLAVAISRLAVAQPPPQNLPDWSGVWNPHELNIFDPTAPTHPDNKQNSSAAYMREFPPYNLEWEAKYKKLLADNVAGKPTDPTAGCVPVACRES